MTLRAFIASAVAFLCLATAPAAFAKPPVPNAAFFAKAEVLADWIDDHSDFGPMPYQPAYIFVTQEEMQYVYFGAGGGPEGMELAAVNVPGVIFLPEGFSLASGRSQQTMVHELVHHMQTVTGAQYDCAGDSEAVAYAMQQMFFLDTGLGEPVDLMIMLEATLCPPDWER